MKSAPVVVAAMLLSACAEPTHLEAAWYLQQDGRATGSKTPASSPQPAPSADAAGADTSNTALYPPSLYLAVRNRSEHSEAITGFTLDPVSVKNGWRRYTNLPDPVILAPGQIVIFNLETLDPTKGGLWVKRWLWKDRLQAAREHGYKLPDDGGEMPKQCSVPVHLKVQLAVDGKSHDVPIDGGMPSYLADAWLANCVALLPPLPSSAPAVTTVKWPQ
jgi:hypothetical protein